MSRENSDLRTLGETERGVVGYREAAEKRGAATRVKMSTQNRRPFFKNVPTQPFNHAAKNKSKRLALFFENKDSFRNKRGLEHNHNSMH